MEYNDFLKSKVRLANRDGFDVDDNEISQLIKPHNRLMVKWMVNGGRRACFARFGLHKTVTQLEAHLLLFRKPQTDNTKAYSDIPVFKEKKEWSPGERKWLREKGYSRAKWQVDAHGFAKSNGDRLLDPNEWLGLEHDQIFQRFREWSEKCVYDFDFHVRLGETLEAAGKLPSGFMLLQPASWSDDVWTDITRMRTLNGSQWSLGKEMHICPMQFDIVDRVVIQMSNPNDYVLDPFSGLGTVPMRAIELGRKGIGFELNPTSFLDSVHYCKSSEMKRNTLTLFDTI